ncbi:MAG: hypothetical protein ABIP35_14400 [Ginsengibacter sp.]
MKNRSGPNEINTGKMSGASGRLASLDFYRGLVMVLLMIESAGFYQYLVNEFKPDSFGYSIAIQFTHAPWHGFHFWDSI